MLGLCKGYKYKGFPVKETKQGKLIVSDSTGATLTFDCWDDMQKEIDRLYRIIVSDDRNVKKKVKAVK